MGQKQTDRARWSKHWAPATECWPLCPAVSSPWRFSPVPTAPHSRHANHRSKHTRTDAASSGLLDCKLRLLPDQCSGRVLSTGLLGTICLPAARTWPRLRFTQESRADRPRDLVRLFSELRALCAAGTQRLRLRYTWEREIWSTLDRPSTAAFTKAYDGW